MTATDELRRMLDERGVEHYDGCETTLWLKEAGRGFRVEATELGADERGDVTFGVHMWCDTPEQAVSATLGPKTCHTVAMDCFGNPPYNTSGLNGNSTACGCSSCGAPWSTCGMFRGNQMKHNFVACPICGAKVVDE